MREDGQTLAVETNIVSASFLQFRQVASCDLFRVLAKAERNRLFARMELFVSDILSSTLSPHVIPLSFLKDLLLDTHLVDNTLLSLDPILFYSETTISLMSVDRKRKIVRLILA